MKTLILYYSWSSAGNTEKLAKYMAEKLGADMEKIIDKKEKKGAIGWVLAGKKAAMKELTELEPLKSDLNQYDLIAIGGPVWSWNIGPVVRTLLTEHDFSEKKIISFCTMDGSGDKQSFATMRQLLGERVEIIGEVSATSKEILSGEYMGKVDELISKLN
jgi:flavodoxin